MQAPGWLKAAPPAKKKRGGEGGGSSRGARRAKPAAPSADGTENAGAEPLALTSGGRRGGGRRGKGGKRRTPEVTEIQAIVPLLAETTLNALQLVRKLEAAETDVALLTPACPFGTELLSAGADYASGVEDAGRYTHDLGPPHLFVWGRAVTWLC